MHFLRGKKVWKYVDGLFRFLKKKLISDSNTDDFEWCLDAWDVNNS